MRAEGTQPGDCRAEAPARLRLVALDAPSISLRGDGGHLCVLAPDGDHSAAAGAVAMSLIGPRAEGVGGAVEIAGRRVSLHSLPAPLLRPSAEPLIGTATLDELWHDMGQRFLHESAAWRAVRSRPRRRAGRSRELDPVVAARVQSLLDGLAERTTLGPDARALADDFDDLVRANAASVGDVDPDVDIDLVAIERRVAIARIAAATAAGRLLPGTSARIRDCHRVVVECERELFEAPRKQRTAALARYQQAMTDERAALADAGVASYASFLVETAVGAAPGNPEVRLRAELELAHAEEALVAGRAALDAARRARVEREVELRANAAELLGRVPGPNAATELRALAAAELDPEAARDEIVSLLALPDTDDTNIETVARKALRAHDTARRRRENDEAADAEVEALSARAGRSFRELDADAAVLTIGALLERYRAGELLAGSLPIVLDGVLDGLDRDVVDAVACDIRCVEDVQLIIVTSDHAVAGTLARRGTPTVTSSSAAPGTEEGCCAQHGGARAIANCARCARASCVDCVTYESEDCDIWCVECAQERASRRRGAHR